MDNKGWREEGAGVNDSRGTAAHWGERWKRESDKSKRISYLFNSLDLKNTRGEHDGGAYWIYFTLSFSLSLFYSLSLSCSPIHIFISKHIRHTFTPSDMCLHNKDTSLSPCLPVIHSTLPLSFNQSVLLSVFHPIRVQHTHIFITVGSLEKLSHNHWPQVSLGLPSLYIRALQTHYFTTTHRSALNSPHLSAFPTTPICLE